ncbi:Hypothetical Protein FCC1311_012602 [Hondaea fermentalgiana]|uniref:Uncharacterized protein n=1 Tax=Hondaea fermentalgiana TaxID=2315210 RepID=A0A2R5G987_9STRA|nr:Hypothetical Protein FCC1311_012602 [Hondaea fermentalgiana]|eukprot:GBG25043.1 Hypothetical Protein FCC1311_012602 [Hondaea fermentalgiana]
MAPMSASDAQVSILKAVEESWKTSFKLHLTRIVRQTVSWRIDGVLSRPTKLMPIPSTVVNVTFEVEDDDDQPSARKIAESKSCTAGEAQQGPKVIRYRLENVLYWRNIDKFSESLVDRMLSDKISVRERHLDIVRDDFGSTRGQIAFDAEIGEEMKIADAARKPVYEDDSEDDFLPDEDLLGPTDEDSEDEDFDFGNVSSDVVTRREEIENKVAEIFFTTSDNDAADDVNRYFAGLELVQEVGREFDASADDFMLLYSCVDPASSLQVVAKAVKNILKRRLTSEFQTSSAQAWPESILDAYSPDLAFSIAKACEALEKRKASDVEDADENTDAEDADGNAAASAPDATKKGKETSTSAESKVAEESKNSDADAGTGDAQNDVDFMTRGALRAILGHNAVGLRASEINTLMALQQSHEEDAELVKVPTSEELAEQIRTVRLAFARHVYMCYSSGPSGVARVEKAVLSALLKLDGEEKDGGDLFVSDEILMQALLKPRLATLVHSRITAVRALSRLVFDRHDIAEAACAMAEALCSLGGNPASLEEATEMRARSDLDLKALLPSDMCPIAMQQHVETDPQAAPQQIADLVALCAPEARLTAVKVLLADSHVAQLMQAERERERAYSAFVSKKGQLKIVGVRPVDDDVELTVINDATNTEACATFSCEQLANDFDLQDTSVLTNPEHEDSEYVLERIRKRLYVDAFDPSILLYYVPLLR